jgi:multisubunit Na+/H+ antiporter MnhB subunit
MIKWKNVLLIASIAGLFHVFWSYSQGLGIEAIAVCASSSLLFFLAFVYLDLKKGA